MSGGQKTGSGAPPIPLGQPIMRPVQPCEVCNVAPQASGDILCSGCAKYHDRLDAQLERDLDAWEARRVKPKRSPKARAEAAGRA